MSDQLNLVAESRTEFGKGAARRARAAGQIPAVIYGHGGEPIHILLPGHATGLALKHKNALLNVAVGKTSSMVIVKDIQRDPVRQVIEHIDLLVVVKGETLTVDVPIRLTGESLSGTIHMLEHATLHVSAETMHLPESFEVSIQGLVEGDRIHAGDVKLPDGVILLGDPHQTVVSITVPKRALEPEAEAEPVVPATPAPAAS